MRWISDNSQEFNRMPCKSVEVFCCTSLLICAHLCICDCAELLSSSGSKALTRKSRNFWEKGSTREKVEKSTRRFSYATEMIGAGQEINFISHNVFHVTKRPFSFRLLFLQSPRKKRKKQHPKTPKSRLPSLPSPQKRQERGMSCWKKKRIYVRIVEAERNVFIKKKRNQFNLRRQNQTCNSYIK